MCPPRLPPPAACCCAEVFGCLRAKPKRPPTAGPCGSASIAPQAIPLTRADRVLRLQLACWWQCIVASLVLSFLTRPLPPSRSANVLRLAHTIAEHGI